MTCCLTKKNEFDVIESIGVVKLNIRRSKNSPKKKKKIQKKNRKYEVDLEVTTVK
jgi:hypothetical protein